MNNKKLERRKSNNSTPSEILLDPNYPKNRFNDRLKYGRLKAGLKAKDVQPLVDKMVEEGCFEGYLDKHESTRGFSESQIYRMERSGANVSSITLYVLCKAYDMSYQWALHHIGLRRPNAPRSEPLRRIDTLLHDLQDEAPSLLPLLADLIEGVINEIDLKKGMKPIAVD